MIKTTKPTNFRPAEQYIAFDGEWKSAAAGEHPLPGNHRILLPWSGCVWMATRDPVRAVWNLTGTGHYRLSADIDLWMPVPDCPEELQPYDAFTRKPRSMMNDNGKEEA